MKLKFALRDEDILSSAKAIDLANQVMRAAAEMLRDADEDITYTGSETYWICKDRLDAFNRKIPGEFTLTQVNSQVYELQYRPGQLTRTLAAKELDADVERTRKFVKSFRNEEDMEDIRSDEAVARARDDTRKVFKRQLPRFEEAYEWTNTDIHKRAVAYLKKPQEEWTVLDWRQYAQALQRMDKRWFGEPKNTPSGLESIIAERQKEDSETDTLDNLLRRLGGTDE